LKDESIPEVFWTYEIRAAEVVLPEEIDLTKELDIDIGRSLRSLTS